MPNGQHDPTPDPGSVNILSALFHRTPDIVSGFFSRDNKGCWSLRGFDHFCSHKARLHRQHIDAVTCQAIAQRFEVGS